MMSEPEQCLEIFPMEVWEGILNYLEHDDLLACRLVCKDWMRLVDDVFERNIWKPYFAKNRVADVLSTFLVKCKGTRFSSPEEVNTFIQQQVGITELEPNRNPFLNHTIILNCRSIDQYTQVSREFPMLVEKYGHHVQHCLYSVHGDVPESVKNIPIIFSLKNLQTLTIYCADWDKRGVRNILDGWKTEPFPAPQLRHFKNLNVLGDRGYTVLKTLFGQYGSQIRRLNCWGHNLMEEASHDFAQDVVETLPNLEEFKICDVSSVLLTSVSSRAQWPLKRLSVKISFTDDTINLGGLMDSFKKYAGTLESFHLQVDERQLHNNVVLYNICFPKVRDIRVPFYFARGVRLFLLDLVKKFPRVEHLQLVDYEDTANKWGQDLQSRERTFDKILNPLWSKLPLSLKVLSVRYKKQGQQIRANGPGSVIYKYRKTRVAHVAGRAITCAKCAGPAGKAKKKK